MTGKAIDAKRGVISRIYADVPLIMVLYYFAFGLYVAGSCLTQTVFSEIGVPVSTFYNLAQVFAAVVLLTKLLLQRCRYTELLLAFCLIAVGVASWFYSKESYLFWIFLFIACGKDVEIKILAKIVLFVVGALTVVTVVAAQFGIIPTYYILETGERAARSSMGFIHPNRLGEYLFTVCLALAIIDFDKRPYRTLAVCAVCFAVAWYISNSQTSSAIILFIALSICLIPLFKKHRRPFLLFALGLFAASFLLSMYFMVAYSPFNQTMTALNEFCSMRLSFMHQGYETYGIALFGQECSNGPIVAYTLVSKTAYTFFVDNAYAHAVIKNGLIPSIVFFLLVAVAFIRGYNKPELDSALFGLMVLAVVGFTEHYFIDISCDYFVVVLSAFVFGSTSLYSFPSKIARGGSQSFMAGIPRNGMSGNIDAAPEGSAV